jgi:glutamine amidotransferase
MSERPRVAVLSLGASNGATIRAGLVRAGGAPFAARAAGDFANSDALVVPGVANLAYLIDALDAAGLRDPLLAAIERGMPVLGVCAGFQLCFEESDEAPERCGLGVFAGRVVAMDAPKLPHMGWNRVEALTCAIASGWAYFAHSFAAPQGVRDAIAVTRHGAAFTSIARRRNVTGVQFHPERSGAYGAALLESFIREAAVLC